MNLNRGNADVPGISSPASLHVLANPVHGDALLGYALPHPGTVRLRIFDLAGREVASLMDGENRTGSGIARWSTAGTPPGVYLARLEGSGFAPIVQRVALVR